MTNALPVINVSILKDCPKSKEKGHAFSAINIWNAGVFANDAQACVQEASRRRKPWSAWKDIQETARHILNECNRLGITFEKPYKWVGQELYVVRQTGVFSVYNASTGVGIYDQQQAKG